MILEAHAKINLHLEVGPKRPDGYHAIKTLFQEIFLHDTLRFSLAPNSISLKITFDRPPHPSLPACRLADRSLKGEGDELERQRRSGSSGEGLIPEGGKNLVVRALELLRKKLKIKKGIHVHLTKRIPVGAGLGGGSSDAAAALWAGWILWKLKRQDLKKFVRPKRVPPLLLRCACQLGADVPFFLRGGIAWAEGIGEKLKPLKGRKKRWLVLIYPRVHVSTKEAYRLLDRGRHSRMSLSGIQSPRPKIPDLDSRFRGNDDLFFNSFEPVGMKKFPVVAAAKQMLVSAGCTGVMMSGSGSAVFGFVRNRLQGERISRRLRRQPWEVYLTYTV